VKQNKTSSGYKIIKSRRVCVCVCGVLDDRRSESEIERVRTDWRAKFNDRRRKTTIPGHQANGLYLSPRLMFFIAHPLNTHIPSFSEFVFHCHFFPLIFLGRGKHFSPDKTLLFIALGNIHLKVFRPMSTLPRIFNPWPIWSTPFLLVCWVASYCW